MLHADFRNSVVRASERAFEARHLADVSGLLGAAKVVRFPDTGPIKSLAGQDLMQIDSAVMEEPGTHAVLASSKTRLQVDHIAQVSCQVWDVEEHCGCVPQLNAFRGKMLTGEGG